MAVSILNPIRFLVEHLPGRSPSSSSTSLKEAAPLGTVADIGLGYMYGGGVDPDEHLYRRLTQAQRELPPLLQERALRLSWALYESNPLAHGIIEMMKDHIVGKGFSAQSGNADVQKVIDLHWNDWQNRWDLKQHDRVRDLSIYGEGLYLVFTNKANGLVRLASLDPLHIRAVITDPDNPEVIDTIVINPRRKPGSNYSDSDRFYRVIHQDEDPASPTYNRLIGAKEGESFTPPTGKKHYPYSGSCFYFTVNSVTGAIRGRSDLLSIIDWLDAYDQILFNFVDRTMLMNNFVWDVELTGATASQILDWGKKHAAAPKPGTVNIHNEGEKWSAVSPTFQRAEFEVQQKTLKAQILSPTGMPPHWFGETQTNKSSATEMSIPALKRLGSRQLFFKYMLEMILQYQVDQAIISGKLTVSAEEERFEVIVPQMSSKDLSVASSSMMNVVQAITIALAAHMIDLVEAQKIFVTLAAELGADVNLDSMITRLKDLGLDPETLAAQAEEDARLQREFRATIASAEASRVGRSNKDGAGPPDGSNANQDAAKPTTEPLAPIATPEVGIHQDGRGNRNPKPVKVGESVAYDGDGDGSAIGPGLVRLIESRPFIPVTVEEALAQLRGGIPVTGQIRVFQPAPSSVDNENEDESSAPLEDFNDE